MSPSTPWPSWDTPMMGEVRSGVCHGIKWECLHIGSQVRLYLWYSGFWTCFSTEWNDEHPRNLVLVDPPYRTHVPFVGILGKLAGVPASMLKVTLENDPELETVRSAFKACLTERDSFLAGWPGNLQPQDRTYISNLVDEESWESMSEGWASLEHPDDFVRRYEDERANPWIQTALKQVRRAIT